MSFVNSKNQLLRDEMHRVIWRIMKRNKVRVWPMRDYYVLQRKNGVIDIVPRSKIGSDARTCPRCGRVIFRKCRILRIHEGKSVDEYVMGCPCGYVFGIDLPGG